MNYKNNAFKLTFLKCIQEDEIKVHQKTLQKNSFNFLKAFDNWCDKLNDVVVLEVDDWCENVLIDFQITLEDENYFEEFEFEVSIPFKDLESFYEEFIN